jgi:hypothetical protein
MDVTVKTNTIIEWVIITNRGHCEAKDMYWGLCAFRSNVVNGRGERVGAGLYLCAHSSAPLPMRTAASGLSQERQGAMSRNG